MAPIAVPSPQTLPLALVADSDPGSRGMYAEYLRFSQWVVEEAFDGPAALAIALARRPDLIIVDGHLPVISGYQLCDLLRKDLATRTTPIVLVTSDGTARELERARTLGATTVLVKPCLPETLLTEAVRLVDLSREQRDLRDTPKLSSRIADAESVAQTSRQRSSRSMSRTHLRGETDLPPSSPPNLICPDCDRALDYKSSQVGGVSQRNAEQWDYFICRTGCGTFQYRQRTRKLRKV
jgi:CheY-like chemotaxis protein